MNLFEYENLSPEARDHHNKAQVRLIHACLITAGIVSFLGMLGLTPMCFLIFWAVGFCYINQAFHLVKKEILRFCLNVIAQITFIAVLLWLHG